MFSDELAGNASRKRQEQAKARRRKIVEEQRKRKEGNETTYSSDKKVLQSASCRVEDTTKERKKSVPIEDFKKEFNVGIKTSKGLVVDKALEQRELRSVQKRSNLAAERIQSSFRAYVSNKKLIVEQKAILGKRLNDLVAVSKLLAKQNQEFCPPPSMVSLMLNQMLFVMHSRPRMRKIRQTKSDIGAIEFQYFSQISDSFVESDAKIIARVIEFGVIPGLLSSDRNLDPSSVWLQSAEGKIKLIKLMRLCIFLIIARQYTSTKRSDVNKQNKSSKLAASEDDVLVIYRMISIIIGPNETEHEERSEVATFCRTLFFSCRNRADYPISIGKRPIKEENLDLISLLRTFLLFPSGMKLNVIPRNADSLREKSISACDRSRADGLYNLISNLAWDRNDTVTSSRLFAEIFTVPLLTWRLEQSTIDNIVGKRSKDEKLDNPPFIYFMEAFLNVHGNSDMGECIPSHDVPITICPSPPLLSLCANMSQLGAICPLIYDNDRLCSTVDGKSGCYTLVRSSACI
jgi:hypothetical protein